MAMTNLRAHVTFTMTEERKARLAAAVVKAKAAIEKLQDSVCNDPWVVVGRTTIDGTFKQVRDAFGGPWESVDDMRYALASGDVFDVGGRSLRVEAKEVHDGGAVVVACEIVRRLSECCMYCDEEHLTHDQRNLHAGECDACRRNIESKLRRHDPAIAQEHPSSTCHECGPHGNAGRVLLASTWVACTVCAGGKPGDAFGAVEAADDPLPFGLDRMTVDNVRSAMRTHLTSMMEQRELVAHAGDAKFAGFVVPTASEVNAALSANLVAEGASIEAGVQAIVALSAPCERRTRIGGRCSSETPCQRCERCM